MLAHDRTGSGLPVIFIHAFPLNRRMWQKNISAIPPEFQMLALDLPGFGVSPMNGDIADMEGMAQSILNTLDEIHLTQSAVFVGLSMGGYVLFQLARLAAERIRALVLVSTRSAPDSEEARNKRYKNIELIEKDGLTPFVNVMKPALFGRTTLQSNPQLVAEASEIIMQNDPNGICAALRGMANRPDSTFFLPKIHCPALVISGEEDVVISSTEMNILSKSIAHSEFEVIPNAGHLLNMEQPEKFNGLLRKFIKRL